MNHYLKTNRKYVMMIVYFLVGYDYHKLVVCIAVHACSFTLLLRLITPNIWISQSIMGAMIL